MIVTIIGSLTKKDEISMVGEYFRSFGNKVHTPEDLNNTGLSLLDIQRQYIKFIEEADLIVVIPKKTNINSYLSKM